MSEETISNNEQAILERIEESLKEFMDDARIKYPYITEYEFKLIQELIDNSLRLFMYRMISSQKESKHKQKQLESNSTAFYEETVMLCHLTLSKMNRKRKEVEETAK